MGFRPMRCSSVAKTSIGLPGCFAASSATHSRAFFKCRRFFGRGRFRVLRTRLLDRPADRLQRFPAPLRGDRGEVEFASHPSRNLAARPQPAIGRRVVKAQAQFSEQVGLQDRCRCAVAAAQVAKSLGSLGIVAGEQLFDPSLARPSSPTLARWCDHAPKARLPGSAAMRWHPHIRQTALPTPRHSNDPRPSPCVPISQLMAPKLICFARPCESPSTSSQSAGNRIIGSFETSSRG